MHYNDDIAVMQWLPIGPIIIDIKALFLEFILEFSNIRDSILFLENNQVDEVQTTLLHNILHSAAATNCSSGQSPSNNF